MRLAIFSPLLPTRSGIATYTAELLPRLTAHHDIELFCDMPSRDARSSEAYPTFSAHDFVWKQARTPYDLVVYQLGNATCHDYMWAYLTRYPGLVVLHDGQLHHARAHALLASNREQRYRAELAFDHPDAPPDIVELGVQRLLGNLMYFWPMLRLPIAASRMVAVHSVWLADQLRAEYPDAVFETLRMGISDPRRDAASTDASREAIRARLGLDPDAIAFGAFGGVTPEKRLPQILRALGAVVATVPSARLVLIGSEASYYDVMEDARAHGVADRVTLTGYVDDRALGGYLAAVDICLCLRWPSSGETSASWLRCLAAGKPTVVTDLAHTGEVPTLVTRSTWTPSHLGSLREYDDERPAPVAVSIDILDEDRSLAIAMRRLASDGSLRRRLGEQARAYWRAKHDLDAMAADYHRVLELAAKRPTRPLPHGLLADGTDRTRALLAPLGLSLDILGQRPS